MGDVDGKVHSYYNCLLLNCTSTKHTSDRQLRA